MKRNVQIVGVPEHFNLPWHLAMEENAFAERGISLEWTDVPEGTGKMVQMLSSGEADLAVILTEGLVKAISDGLQAVIVQQFIASPLLWGIHVDAKSPYQTVGDIEGTRAAISRFGSGSHLMAYVNAESLGWSTDTLEFEVVNTLEGAVKGLAEGTADYFLWERFTTQPLVDREVFRRIGECPTPWPCFVIAARRDFAESKAGLLADILEVINLYTKEFPMIPSIDRTLSNRYGQRLEQVRDWLSRTRWSQEQVKTEDIDKVINTLSQLNLLSNPVSTDKLLWSP